MWNCGWAPRRFTSRRHPRPSFSCGALWLRRFSACAGIRTRSRASERADLFVGQAAPFADLQVADAHRANGQAHEFQYLTPDGFDHAPHLTVAAFGDDYFKKRVFGRIADALSNGRTRGTVIQIGAAAQAVELFPGEQRGCFRSEEHT